MIKKKLINHYQCQDCSAEFDDNLKETTKYQLSDKSWVEDAVCPYCYSTDVIDITE